jgi:serine/threonine protein kinase
MAPSRSKDGQRIGSDVDMYRIVDLLGRGGMGAVYKAVHRWTGREVAIKFLHPYLGNDERSLRRFMKEARAATALRHPNVVDVLHMGEHGGEVYLVMELLRGKTLREHLRDHPRLSEAEALALVLPVVDALAHGHALGVVHRDIKPDNIFLACSGTGAGIPKLLDFGVAKLTDPSESSSTVTGALLGTPQYMSPEQANGEVDVGPATDVWAVGMVLYECLTGGLPFRHCTALPSLLLKLVTEDIPAISTERPDLSASVANAIDTALRRDRAARYASMAELVVELRSAAQATGLSHAATLLDHVPKVAADHPPSYGPVEGPALPNRPLTRWLMPLLVVFSVVIARWLLGADQPVADNGIKATVHDVRMPASYEAGRAAVEPPARVSAAQREPEPSAGDAGVVSSLPRVASSDSAAAVPSTRRVAQPASPARRASAKSSAAHSRSESPTPSAVEVDTTHTKIELERPPDVVDEF